MARAVGVMALGSVGEVRVVSAPWRETTFVREPGMALAMHDVSLCTPPEPLRPLIADKLPALRAPSDRLAVTLRDVR